MQQQEIQLFKTDLCCEKQIEKLSVYLQQVDAIIGWNVDLEDVDAVLRVETLPLPAKTIIDKVKEAGFYCEELPD